MIVLIVIVILLVAWGSTVFSWTAWRSNEQDADEAPAEQTVVATRARIGTVGLVIAVAMGSVAYQLIFRHRLQQSAALFVGIPTLLAIAVILFTSPRSATGVACKTVTIALLISMLFFWEGMLCVAMAAPLFYAIAVVIGGSVDMARRRRLRKRTQSTLSCIAVLALIPLCLEGVTDMTSFDRDEWVTRTQIVRASADRVGQAIFELPRFERPLPAYLRAGFPRPTATRIESHAGRARWIVTFRGGEMRLNGMEPRAGDLVLEIDTLAPRSVRWRAVGDDSHVTHFLRWREAAVQWEPAAGGTTRVTWKLRYRRGLDPAWYFGPWERYAAGLAAGYLIDSVATP